MDKNYFKVDEDSNPRGKTLNEQEIKQCILDYSSWLKNNASKVYQNMNANQKPTKLDNINQLPLSVNLILNQFNGGLQLLDSFVMFSDSQILNCIEEHKIYGFWSKQFIPIAKDSDDNLLIINLEKDGQVVTWNRDQGIDEECADTFENYIENITNSVLKNQYEFIEDVGLVKKI